MKIFKDVTEYPRKFKDILEHSRMSRNIQEYPRIFKNSQEHSRTFKDIQEHSRMFKNIQEYSGIFQNSHLIEDSNNANHRIFKPSAVTEIKRVVFWCLMNTPRKSPFQITVQGGCAHEIL